MIPKITQDGPSIMPRYWCAECGHSLPTSTFSGEPIRWKFCPECGQAIEWDKVVPIKWEPMDCDTCGRPMIREVTGTVISTGAYVGTTTCRTCMMEYCSSTNCLGCRRGTYPNCKWLYLKRNYHPVTIFERHGDNDYSMWTTELPTELTYQMQHNGFAAEGDLQSVAEQLPAHCDGIYRKYAILYSKDRRYHLFVHGLTKDFLEAHRNDGAPVRGTWDDIMGELREQESGNRRGAL